MNEPGFAPRSGLSGGGGLIERPERLIIVLVGAGLSGVWFLHAPWLVHVAMWVLAVASLITLGQRLHTVRTSPGAMERLQNAESPNSSEKPETWGHSPRKREAHPPGGQGDET